MIADTSNLMHIAVKLPGLTSDCDMCMPMIRELYYQVLKEDDLWHFFREFDLLFIRVSNGNALIVEKYLCDRNLEYTVEPYVENMGIAKKHLWYFLPFFHLTSVLAIVSGQEEASDLLARVGHCFANIMLAKNRPIIHAFHKYLGYIKWDKTEVAIESAKAADAKMDFEQKKFEAKYTDANSRNSVDKES